MAEKPLIAYDGESCPPLLPLSPETLQLFEDPLGSLNRIVHTSGESTPSLNIHPSYPGRLSPGEEEERKENPDGEYHNTDDVDGEEWRSYDGKEDVYKPCEIYEFMEYTWPLCCRWEVERPDPPVPLLDYYRMEDCDLNIGTSIDKKKFFFRFSHG